MSDEGDFDVIVFSPGGVCPICGEKDGTPHGEPCRTDWTVDDKPMPGPERLLFDGDEIDLGG